MRLIPFLLAALWVGTWCRPARADVSSWLFVGPGPSWIQQGGDDAETQFSLQMEAGMGSPPRHPVIVGGLFRVQPHFGRGTDLALMVRTATHGFVNGDWGGAIDLGGYQRFWGIGSTGATGSLVLGAPWGITLSASASMGSNDALGFSGVLGLDLARLTVYRRSGTSWWRNTFPAYRPQDEAR